MKTIVKKQAEPVSKCLCGCQGEPAGDRSFFMPGHDQKAINNVLVELFDCPPIKEFKGRYPKNDMRANFLLSIGYVDESGNRCPEFPYSREK